MRRALWIVGAVACALCCMAGPARAVWILGDDMTANIQEIDLGEYTADGDVDVGLGDVIYDPNAGPLLKIFTVPDAPGDHKLTLNETFHVGADPTDPAIYDWHEVLMVLDPVGGWMPAVGVGLSWVSDVTVTPLGGISIIGPTLSLYWQEGLPYCTDVDISKTIDIWMGPGYFGAGDQFAVLQWPTVPEPATMALMGLGLGSLWMRKRRKA